MDPRQTDSDDSQDAPGAPSRRARPHLAQSPGLQVLLLEPRQSAFFKQVEEVASALGISVEPLEALERAASDDAVVGIGPSIREPLQVARTIRRLGGEPLIVFFAASRSARDALHAELIRDPFVAQRYELIDVSDEPRQVQARVGQVVARLQRQRRHGPSGARRPRGRSRGAPSRSELTGVGEDYIINILAQANDAILSTDAEARLLAWNLAAERLFGYPAHEVLGRSLDFLDPGSRREKGLAVLGENVFTSGRAEHADVVCRAADGREFRVAASVAPVTNAEGMLLGLSVIARDDSAHQRAEEALRDANRQKDEFLAIMSHELRTPLTSILGYTDMLLRGLSGPLGPRTSKYLSNVRSAGDRLLDLVNGLLDYTRLEAGTERLDLQPVDLGHLVHHVAQGFTRQAAENNVDLGIERQPIGKVRADPDKIQHVMRSLIGNACKFTPAGGWIAVRVGPDLEQPDSVRVTVEDSGIGLREDQIPRVWERFYQGDASLTRAYGGMGLGLSIARHLVTLHGGSVGADSPGEGLGSTFWFSIPCGAD